MTNLLMAALLLGGILAWLLIAARHDGRRVPAKTFGTRALGGWRRRLATGLGGVAVAAALVVGSGVLSQGEDEPTGISALFGGLIGAVTLVLGLVGLGWLATFTSRRRMRALGEAAEPVMLRGGRLQLIRVVWLCLYSVLGVVVIANLGALWAEASRVRFAPVPYDTFLGEGWYSLSVSESRLFRGSSPDAGFSVPSWYPWLVVIRQAVIYAGVMGLAWFVFSRRPRHWMAFFVSIFIPLLAWATVGDGGAPRLDEIWLPLGYVAGVLQLLAMLATGAFLWVFPDGRFRGTYARYIAVLALVGLPLGWFASGDAWESRTWAFVLVMIALIASGGIATQVFRYRRASSAERREARWTLVVLLLLVVWLTGGTSLNSAFDGATWPAFIWRQIHLTLYVATPLILGFFLLWLVRRQGWWDLDLFVHRSAVLAVLTPTLGALYLGVVFAVGAVFSEWTDQNGVVLAVVAATVAVAVAYQPTSRRVQAAIDRRFFPQRAHTMAMVEGFDAELRSDVTQGEVRQRLLTTVDKAFEPGVATLWLRPAPETRQPAPRQEAGR
jgi:hypothetical protein